MGDMAEVFREMQQDKKERHERWWSVNMKIIGATAYGYRTENAGQTILFRENNKPKVDFYPHTGRWRIAGNPRTFSGGAKKFIEWYTKARIKENRP